MKTLIGVLLVVLSLGCMSQSPAPTQDSAEPMPGENPHQYTEEESLDIAREFVLKCPTYQYDGSELAHVETTKGDCSSCWIFVFEFTSRKAGYGDRSKQNVAQVITQHTAYITVENGKVVIAVMDNVWDMIGQSPAPTQNSTEPIPEENPHQYTEEESLDIAREFVLKCPTYQYDGSELIHIQTTKGDCSSCWIFVFEFTSRKAGYGDRSKQNVAQVITQHTAYITMENGKVVIAVMDNVWDMIGQKMIE
ncbi:MAG: hypothetical protein HXS44_11610 [Theionarchaea archaeon]|nr:hypothetical protein [Theionarchaea archaeon]